MQTVPPPRAADNDEEPPVDELSRQATLWVVRLTSGDTTAQDREDFRRWRDASPDHAAALAAARRQWLLLGQGFDAQARRSARPASRNLRIGAIAASFLVCAILGQQALAHFNHDYVTGGGERRTIALADGTRMVLGARSAVDVRFDEAHRTIKLARGTVYFDVGKDGHRPFAVQAGANEIRDIGTAFSVRRKGSGGDVVVAQGEIEISGDGAPLRVKPDQAAAFGPGADRTVRPIDARQDLRWIDGQLVLVNRSLAEAVAQLNLYYKGKLVLMKDGSAAPRITAVITLDNIDGWLDALDKSGTAKVSRIGPVVLLR